MFLLSSSQRPGPPSLLLWKRGPGQEKNKKILQNKMNKPIHVKKRFGFEKTISHQPIPTLSFAEALPAEDDWARCTAGKIGAEKKGESST